MNKDYLFKRAFQDSSIGMALVCGEGKWLDVNGSLCSILGYSKEFLLKKNFQSLTHPDDLKAEQESMEQCLTGKSDSFSLEKRYFHKSGALVWVLLSVSCLRDEKGSKFFMFQIQDITENKKNQEALAHSSKMAALGEMAAGIAHEINNPLTIIEGNASILKRWHSQEQTPNLKMIEHISKISATVQRISAIANGIKNFAKDGRMDEAEECPLKEVLQESLFLCQEKFSTNGVKVDLQPVDGILVKCRKIELSQVFLNLLNNSCQALKGLPKKTISIRFEVESDLVKVFFKDSGKGVSPELRDKIMRPFFTTKPIGEGVGLGLSLSKSIMERMNGDLVFLQDIKETTFCVEVPLVAQKSKKSA